MYSMRVTGHVKAPRAAVFRALVDPDAIASWRVPDGMRAVVHEFEAIEGGAFRVSLRYSSSGAAGKSSSDTDTYHGRFVTLVPDQKVVEEIEFESGEAALHGLMTMTTSLVDADGGTDVTIVHDGIPDAVPAADNEQGTRMALAQLARFVEAG